MAVFLTVLKIIGIVLLALLALVLLIALIVLFVPVHYALDASVPDTDLEEASFDKVKEGLYVKASFHWLLHLIRGRFVYPDAPELILRPKFLSRFMGGSAENEKKSPDEVFEKMRYTISSVCDKIGMVRATLESETFDRAKDCVLKQTKRLLKGIRPKKCDINLRFGTGDPVLTAEVYAAYSMLLPLIGSFAYVRGDFTTRMIGGNARIRGRITVFRVLSCVLILYFNKDVRRIKDRFEKIRRKADEPESV